MLFILIFCNNISAIEIYKKNRITKALQYCIDKNIVRLWNEDLLNYDFVNRNKQSNQIDEIADDILMIDEKVFNDDVRL